MNRKKVVIIGAGASGLLCAALLPKETKVTLLERLSAPGKKLLATGNGRCNLTNQNTREYPERFYHGDALFAGDVIRRAGPDKVRAIFRQLGLETETEPGTPLVYPATRQAKSVQHILQYNCRLSGARLMTDCPVTKIQTNRTGSRFSVWAGSQPFPADYVILATGGRSNAGLGSDGSGYRLAAELGHNVLRQFPALVQLTSSSKYPRKLKGTRIRADLGIEVDGAVVTQKSGEILFTDYGLSGICAMEASRSVSQIKEKTPGKRITAVLNLLPGHKEPELQNEMKLLLKRGFRAEELLTGYLPMGLAEIIAAQAEGVPKKMITIAQHWRLILTGTLGFPTSQVTCGGVDTADVIPDTMESRLQKGLYLTGELLNVDGDCGGYNLQFAWSCAILAAEAIAKDIMK